jgi:signal peptidase
VPSLHTLARCGSQLLFGVLAIAWFVLLRPVALGGPASYVIVSGVSMEPRLHTGDLVIAHAEATYAVGDVVAYHIPPGYPAAGTLVIHRIVGGSPDRGFVVRGDNKDTADPWRPTPANVVGREWIAFPGSGRLFLALRTPAVLGLLVGGIAGVAAYSTFGRTHRRARAPSTTP